MTNNVQATWPASSLPQPSDVEERSDVLWQELQQRFDWYDHAARRSRLAYHLLKLAFLVASASVTVLAAVSARSAVTAALAASLIVLEGVQQLFRFHANWISYRATAETLRAQAIAYVSGTDPYDDSRDRRSQMADFLRDTSLRENATWARIMKTRSTRGPGSD